VQPRFSAIKNDIYNQLFGLYILNRAPTGYAPNQMVFIQ